MVVRMFQHPHYATNRGEKMTEQIYPDDIPLCPLCRGDCLTFDQVSDFFQTLLLARDEDLAFSFVVCQKCLIVCLDEDLDHRTEYVKQIHHTDDDGGLLIEIQRSATPTLDQSTSDWFTWDDGPVLETSFAGIDEQFRSIMEGEK